MDRGEEEDTASTRPSGPATLFDFLETKIPAKSGYIFFFMLTELGSGERLDIYIDIRFKIIIIIIIGYLN